jgi:hypothetical protein
VKDFMNALLIGLDCIPEKAIDVPQTQEPLNYAV